MRAARARAASAASLDLLRCERDEGDDVGGAHARMDADVLAQVAELHRGGDAGNEGVEQSLPRRGERVDGAVVVGIGVHVEQQRISRERRSDRGDRLRAPPFRDVGHGLEHDPYPTKPCPTRTREADPTRAGARSCASSASCARIARH